MLNALASAVGQYVGRAEVVAMIVVEDWSVGDGFGVRRGGKNKGGD